MALTIPSAPAAYLASCKRYNDQRREHRRRLRPKIRPDATVGMLDRETMLLWAIHTEPGLITYWGAVNKVVAANNFRWSYAKKQTEQVCYHAVLRRLIAEKKVHRDQRRIKLTGKQRNNVSLTRAGIERLEEFRRMGTAVSDRVYGASRIVDGHKVKRTAVEHRNLAQVGVVDLVGGYQDASWTNLLVAGRIR